MLQTSPRSRISSAASLIEDRALGCFIGLAIGDALGATLEFAPYDPLRFHSEMMGGGPFGLRPGEWTDDTAMALALADALLDRQGFSPAGFMQRLASWVHRGSFACQGHCVDIGRTTLGSITRFVETGQALCPKVNPHGAGNGSLVRLAPIALRHLHDAHQARRIARLQSRCTHPASAAADACAVLVELLRELILGTPNALAPRTLPWPAHPDITAIVGGTYLSLHRPRVTGYAADTLETALWAVSHTESFEAALVAATSLGGDADSIGAVTGMLAGAMYGLSAIPQRWLHQLAWKDELTDIGHGLLALPASSHAATRVTGARQGHGTGSQVSRR